MESGRKVRFSSPKSKNVNCKNFAKKLVGIFLVREKVLDLYYKNKHINITK